MFRHAVNKVFPVYKPKGWTSRQATDFVQNALTNELTNEEGMIVRKRDKVKVGHGGTLDPMAEGVLVIGVGKGCKELPNYLSGTKEYLVEAKLGQATDTFDAVGKVMETKDTSHITQELLNRTLPSFTGNITQVPPIYSALKIQGKRLYDYARQDIKLPEPIKARNVYIEQLSLTSLNQEDMMIELKVICGGGTYMRSLVHDLAISMGTCGHMTALKRTRQGKFHLNDALLLDDTLGKKIIIKGE